MEQGPPTGPEDPNEESRRLVQSILHGDVSEAVEILTNIQEAHRSRRIMGEIATDKALANQQRDEAHEREVEEINEILRDERELGSLVLVHSAEVVEHVEPRIYVACLAAYNEGRLHGKWLVANQEPDELWEGIRSVLATSPVPGAEEWAIHDYENFYGIRLGEWESIEKVSSIARGIDEHGEAFALWCQASDLTDVKDLAEAFSDHYVGEFEGEPELAAHLTEEFGIDQLVEEAQRLLPEAYRYYMDFDGSSWVRDLVYGGELNIERTSSGTVVAFWVR